MQGARLQPCGTPSPKSRAGLVPVAGVSSQTGQCLAEQWPVRMWRLWVRIRSGSAAVARADTAGTAEMGSNSPAEWSHSLQDFPHGAFPQGCFLSRLSQGCAAVPQLALSMGSWEEVTRTAVLLCRVLCLTWRKPGVFLPSDLTGVLEALSINTCRAFSWVLFCPT